MIGPFQEKDGAFSMRRVLAIVYAIASIGLAFYGMGRADVGWIAFLPSIAFMFASIGLLFLTTWAEIIEAIKAYKGA